MPTNPADLLAKACAQHGLSAILPRDPIIPPAKSMQTRAEAIEEDGDEPLEDDAATSAHPAPILIPVIRPRNLRPSQRRCPQMNRLCAKRWRPLSKKTAAKVRGDADEDDAAKFTTTEQGWGIRNSICQRFQQRRSVRRKIVQEETNRRVSQSSSKSSVADARREKAKTFYQPSSESGGDDPTAQTKPS